MPEITRRARYFVMQVWPRVVTRWQQGRQWLMTTHKPLTWAALRAKLTLTTVPLPKANGSRLAVLGGVGVLLFLGLRWYALPEPGEKGAVTYPHASLINPFLTVATALGAGAFALMRHFQTLHADRQRRITESYSKAVEQLSSDKIEQRLGGIYTLERISKESPDDYWTIMETLTAFVRERAQWKEPDAGASETVARYYVGDRTDPGKEPSTDIAAVLAVIIRRPEKERQRERREGWQLELRGADLRRANLGGAHLEGAVLDGAHLEHAFLSETHLEGAVLGRTHLERAYLSETHLEGAVLWETHFEGANLGGAHLEDASLWKTHLEGAHLSKAHLEGAQLSEAHLEGAQLSEAIGLTQAQIDTAIGDAKTTLPDGLSRPAHWLAAPPGQNGG
jgi:hypothetical protein